MLGSNTGKVGRKDIQARVLTFTHPVLALGRNLVSCAGEYLDSSDTCKKGETAFSLTLLQVLW